MTSVTVMVVDDHDDLRTMAVRLLAMLGHDALEARDGLDAEALMREQGSRIQAVLLDVYLRSGPSGELADRLERARPGLRVLFMSGYGRDDVGGCGLPAPRRHFIEKPFSLGALSAALTTLLASDPDGAG